VRPDVRDVNARTTRTRIGTTPSLTPTRTSRTDPTGTPQHDVKRAERVARAGRLHSHARAAWHGVRGVSPAASWQLFTRR
jgi:hypothetical protein